MRSPTWFFDLGTGRCCPNAAPIYGEVNKLLCFRSDVRRTSARCSRARVGQFVHRRRSDIASWAKQKPRHRHQRPVVSRTKHRSPSCHGPRCCGHIRTTGTSVTQRLTGCHPCSRQFAGHKGSFQNGNFSSTARHSGSSEQGERTPDERSQRPCDAGARTTWPYHHPLSPRNSESTPSFIPV